MASEAKHQIRDWLATLTPEKRAKMEQILRPFGFVSPEIVVIASFSPGFSYDLSSWKIFLSRSGRLTQDIIVSRPPNFGREKRREERDVGANLVAKLLRRADEVDFWNLEVEPNGDVTDMPSLRLSIRNGEKNRTYWPDSVSFWASEGDNAARHFMELWNLIHSLAPFPEDKD